MVIAVLNWYYNTFYYDRFVEKWIKSLDQNVSFFSVSDKTSRQKTDEHPFPPKPKSLSLEASRQQLNQPDKPVTAKPKDETRYFEVNAFHFTSPKKKRDIYN